MNIWNLVTPWWRWISLGLGQSLISTVWYASFWSPTKNSEVIDLWSTCGSFIFIHSTQYLWLPLMLPPNIMTSVTDQLSNLKHKYLLLLLTLVFNLHLFKVSTYFSIYKQDVYLNHANYLSKLMSFDWMFVWLQNI